MNPFLRKRASEENPLSPTCKSHLRRICGVCTHWRGRDLLGLGYCRQFHTSGRGATRADGCSDWARRTEADVVSEADEEVLDALLGARDASGRLSPEGLAARRARVAALVAEGKNRRDIMAALDVTDTALRGDLKHLGLNPPRAEPRLLTSAKIAERRKEVAARLARGETQASIARSMDISVRLVWKDVQAIRAKNAGNDL